MHALVVDHGFWLQLDRPRPTLADETLVRVRLAGICNTDIELVRGYMGFRGVPGHEFVGEVVESASTELKGARVVGEINAGCRSCPACATGLERHCPRRTVLGILGRDGSHAEYLSLPAKNLHSVPAELDDELAVLTEPLAAAYEVIAQRPPQDGERWLVLGDGKLGLLVAAALQAEGAEPVLAGKHPSKLALAASWQIAHVFSAALTGREWDVVVECTGARDGLARALSLVRPRGTVVLKSTVVDPPAQSLAPMVVDEITVLGSRCGLFDPALAGFTRCRELGIDLRKLIDSAWTLDQGVAAYGHAASPGALKVLLTPNRPTSRRSSA